MKAFFVFIFTFEICQSMNTAPYNDKFATCCKEKGVTNSCQQYCNFNFHPNDVIAAFANGTCSPEADTAPYYQCLQNSKNMTKCCNEYGVVSLKKPRYCLDLCDGSTPIKYDAKYASCEPVQSSIMSCGIDSYYDSSKMIHKSSGLKGTSDPEWTQYEIGYSFTLYGTLSCDDKSDTVNGGTVILMEYDPATPNDEFGRAEVVETHFTLRYDKSIWDGDFPDGHYEFYLLFRGLCGHWRDQKSGVVLNDMIVTYVIMDNLFNTYAYVPEPFPQMAKDMTDNNFRYCWFNPTQGTPCDFAEILDARKQAEKFKPDGLGPGK